MLPCSNLPICIEHTTRPLDLLEHHNYRRGHIYSLALYELEQFRERECPICQPRRDDPQVKTDLLQFGPIYEFDKMRLFF
jgi:hypothetical protein